MNKALILVLIAECWMTLGQICFKKSANRLVLDATRRNLNSNLNSGYVGWHLLWQYPTLWVGAAAMLVGLLFWLAALGSGELSFVYLLGSIQYIFALFAAHFFLQEKINTTKLVGTLLITLGIILTAVS